jgi:hypothetical protein
MRDFTKKMKKWFGFKPTTGWTEVPNAFLDKAASWGLDHVHVMIVIYLLKHRYTEADPTVAIATLAKEVGRSSRAVHYGLLDLDVDATKGKRFGLLRRIHRKDENGDQTSNAYDLSPLFERLKREAGQSPGVIIEPATPVQEDADAQVPEPIAATTEMAQVMSDAADEALDLKELSDRPKAPSITITQPLDEYSWGSVAKHIEGRDPDEFIHEFAGP